MASKLTSPSYLPTIPREVRSIIYNNLEDEDLTPLAQTCKEIRHEVLSRMPGGNFIDFGRVHNRLELRRQIDQSIEVENLDLIAEPWYSSGSALKIGVTWRPRSQDYFTRWRTSYWTIRDLSSPMAQFIYLYWPNDISITFQAPTKGYHLIALMILRTKLFDICRILMNVESNSSYVATEALNIRFCGGRDPDRPTMARTPFWEMRPRCNFPKAITRQEVWAKPNTKKSDQDRDMYPFFYECLLLPLVSYTEEPVVNIHFDLEPGRRRTSYYRHPPVQNGLHRQRHYLGHRALFDFAHHCFELHSIGDDYFGYARSGDFERVMERLEFFTEDTESFLRNPKCQESDQLRAYLRRIRQAPVCNPFAGPQERNPFDINEEEQVTNELFVWRCYGEDDAMREKLIGWAMEEEDV